MRFPPGTRSPHAAPLRLAPLLWPLAALWLVGACDESSAASPTTTETEPAESEEAVDLEAPLEPPDPNDAIAVRMAETASTHAEGLTPATPLLRGALGPGERQDFQAILVGRRCFRVLGVGTSTVIDLDLLLFDPNGVQVQQDTSADALPILGHAHPLCPERPGAYRIQARMLEGAGEFGVQVFQTR